MCGINGVFGESNPGLVSRMNRALVHRGPDDEGIYHDDVATLGMRRLSIIDLEGGAQPMANEEGNLWLVFNGEIYNHLDLREDLEARGHFFSTRCDTESIVHLVEEKGAEAPRFLRGDFAYAAWDSARRQGVLARDHLGVKPLYYAPIGDSLLFSSELDALACDDRLKLEIDPQALDLYLSLLYIPAPWTIFRNVFKLPPGSVLLYQRGRSRLSSYWQPPAPGGGGVGPDEEREIYQLLEESVKVRLMSDVPLGAFLSGGVDSSAIVALMSRHSSRPVKTFSVGYGPDFSSFDELEYARLVARHYGTEHYEFVLEPDIEQTVREVIDSFDEPFADSSAVPTYLVSRQIAGRARVALSGVGGDEVFGGYPRYLGAVWNRHYGSLPRFLRRLMAGAAGYIPESESSRNLGGWLRRFLSRPCQAPLDRYLGWITHTPPECPHIYSEQFRAGLSRGKEEYCQQLISLVEGWELPDQAMHLDLVSYLPNDLLWMADHMGMANSLEVRVPFCDFRLVEKLSTVGWRDKMSRFQLKKLLKRLLERDLPEQILARKKQGFMIPVGSWMRRELRPLLDRYLAPEVVRSQGIFDSQSVATLLQAHMSGHFRHTHQLWALLVFQAWHQKRKKRVRSPV